MPEFRSFRFAAVLALRGALGAIGAVAVLGVAAPSALAAAAAPASAAAPPVQPASAAGAEPTPQQRQLRRIRELRAQRPGDGLLVYYEALTLAAMGPAEPVVAALRQLEGRRLGLVPAKTAGFDAVWDDPGFQAVRRRLMDDEPVTPTAPVLRRLHDPRLIPEGIAYDARRRVHYVGSIAQRKIVAVDARGRVRDFSRASDRLEAVLGLAIDAPRDRLCAVSTNGFEAAAVQQRRNAVVCWSLRAGTGRTGERLTARNPERNPERIEAPPDALQLNDLAFARDGTLYVTDSAAGSLWMLPPGARHLLPVGAAGSLRGANGVAVAPDGIVYVTLSTGIARVQPHTGQVMRLPQPDDVVTGGIDGLYWHDGDLLGVQNVSNPGRVVRILLADDGQRIRGLTVLQSHHHPAFVEPTTGVLVGDALHVIANSHVAAYQPDGTIREPHALQGTAIVAVPVRTASGG
jgi:sugar lactone lactonase YvrE